ncbi:hypothetical protein [Streptomyces sp. NPDC048643]|uniref:hypothetical protein n=1 Tax=Streptomyces sp. NPDC048643 TaxID=3155637 RepID=UPI00344AF4BE
MTQAVIEVGARLRYDGRAWTLAVLEGARATLVSDEGASAVVLLPHLFADPSFEVEGGPAPGRVPPFGLLEALPVDVRERALVWQRHVREVETGFPNATGQGAPREQLAPLGVGVTIVEPGYFRTDFLDSSSLHAARTPIADHGGGPAAAMRETAQRVNHGQPGDPAKTARVIVEVVDSGRAPLRLQLGADSVGSVERKLASVREELDAWRTVSVSTNHDDAAA